MLRKATPEETRYYEQKLYPMQDEILSMITTDRIYLTGGTCLSRFYYQHRYSDDLDLFYDAKKFPKEDFTNVFYELVDKLKSKFIVEVQRDDEYFKRVFVEKDGAKLKMEFVLDHLPLAAPLVKINNFYLDSKINVGANKITTVYHRKTFRDYFDLSFLLQDYPLPELIKYAETKIVPLDYVTTLLALNAPSYGDPVRMIKEVSIFDFENFIKSLQRQLLEHAKKIS